ncbi:MAG: phosphoglycerate kinase, partial [Bdellovibrionales bacterium]
MNLPPLSHLDVKNKTVLLRLDLNIETTDVAAIAGNYRTQASLPVLRDLIARDAKIVILANRGRPKGIDPALTNAPLAKALQQ